MADVKLNFAHVCENAFLSQDGKINIIGDFDSITIKRLETGGILFFPFFIVTNFSVDANIEYKQRVSLIDSATGNEILSKEIDQKTSGVKIGLMMRVDAIFPSAGKYKVRIELNDFQHEVDILINEQLDEK